MKAIWNDEVIAESNDVVLLEGNYYLPEDSINKAFFKSSEYTSTCRRKGVASYFHLNVNGEVNDNAAWYYPQPNEVAGHIQNRVAFWKGVKVQP